jgi:hypothetical protein
MELEISVAKGFATFLMKYHFSTFKLIAFAGEELVEIEIEEALLRQITYVQAGEFVLLFFTRSFATTSNVQVL